MNYNMNFTKWLLSSVFLLIISISTAQNTVDYTVFNHSLNLINPALVGQNGEMQVAANYKRVWGGVNEPIHTSILNFSMPFKGLGVGASVIRDDFYLFNETIVALDFSYGVKLNRTNDLLFGIKAQGAVFNANLSRIHTEMPYDPSFTDVNNSLRPNFAVGIALKNENYFGHITVMDLLKNKRFDGNSDLISNAKHFRINAGGGFYKELNESLDLTTTALFRFIEGSPFSFDLTSMLTINKKIDVGFSYRFNNSVMGNILVDITPKIQMGYSYALHFNDLLKYSNGTYEIFLRYHIAKKTKNNKKWKLRCF